MPATCIGVWSIAQGRSGPFRAVGCSRNQAPPRRSPSCHRPARGGTHARAEQVRGQAAHLFWIASILNRRKMPSFDGFPVSRTPHQCPALLLAGGGEAEPLFMGAIAEPLLAGAWVEASVAGAAAGAAAVAAGGGVAGTCGADSSFLPHALRASTATTEAVHIRIGRVIFIGNLLRSGKRTGLHLETSPVITGLLLTGRVHEGNVSLTSIPAVQAGIRAHGPCLSSAH